ncbi:MAG: hypothetical protein Q9195_004479 [Heterodermia aff. obscurata]
MHSSVALLLAAGAAVLAQQTIPSPDYDQGWCYFCSDDNAPPLCNSQCLTAVDRLCNNGDTTKALSDVEGNCTIKYMPPTYDSSRQGSRQPGVTPEVCTNRFTSILLSCGKDAGSPTTATVNQSYCTTSGGGGTFGWNDDGSIMDNSTYHDGRYVITTLNTDQCGQHQASWKQATSVIQWNDSWVSPDDQVILDTNPPALTGSALAAATAIPQPNPECETEVCDIYDNPYYAHSPIDPWQDDPKNNNLRRHRVLYEGWSDDEKATALFNSIYDRCGVYPGNFQAYLNGSGPQHIADFDLPYKPTDLCGCIPWAIFDASVGIEMPLGSFCGATVPEGGGPEFVPIR